jgi:hypothetical protein
VMLAAARLRHVAGTRWGPRLLVGGAGVPPPPAAVHVTAAPPLACVLAAQPSAAADTQQLHGISI